MTVWNIELVSKTVGTGNFASSNRLNMDSSQLEIGSDYWCNSASTEKAPSQLF
jgi:hypothetical protein